MFDAENKKNSRINAVDVEFEDVSVTSRSSQGKQSEQKKAVFLKQIDKISASVGVPITSASDLIAGGHKEAYSYDFDSNILLSCKVESWGRGVSIFADFIRDAKKYYKKTCLSAKYIYFFSYRPTYKEMSHDQLCWYLYWRSAIRDGNYIKTGLTYIFLYLYEQINLCDIIGTDKVYKNIMNIWKNYRAEFPRIDKYIAEWLIDFSLIHKIKIDLDKIEDILPNLLNSVTLPEIYMQDGYFKKESYVDALISNISAYDYKKSKFYEANKEAFNLHIRSIVHMVLSSTQFEEIFNAEIQDGVKIKATRESYSGAVCVYENKWKITVEYKNAYKNFFFKRCITDIIRYAENILREHLGIKSRLPIEAFPDKIRPVVEKYQQDNLPAPSKAKAKKTKKTEENPDAEIQITEFSANIESAAKIEKQSWDTTVTLVELQQRDSGEKDIQVKSQPIPVLPKEDEFDSFAMFAIDTNDTSFEDYGDISEIAESKNVKKNENIDNNINNIENIVIEPEEAKTKNFGNYLDYSDASEYNQSREISEDKEISEIGKFVSSLNDIEYSVLSALASNSGKTPFEVICAEFLNESGIMIESVIDEINGKAMDFIGDIIFDLSASEIIGDYRDDLLLFLQN